MATPKTFHLAAALTLAFATLTPELPAGARSATTAPRTTAPSPTAPRTTGAPRVALTTAPPSTRAGSTDFGPTTQPTNRTPAGTAAPGRARVPFTVGRGESIVFRASGPPYQQLQSIRVSTVKNGRATAAPAVTAKMASYSLGGRWVEVAVAGNAAAGTYRVEGLVGGKLAVVFPVDVAVTTSTRGPAPTATIPKGRAIFRGTVDSATASKLRVQPALRMLTIDAIRGLSGETTVPLIAAVGGFDCVPVPGPEPHCIPASTTISIPTAPNTQVERLVPETGSVTGAIVEIQGQALPHTAVEIRHGTTVLTIESKSATSIVARLPSSPATADLVMVRTTDSAQAVLATGYVVAAPSAPKAFDQFVPDATVRTWKQAYLLSLLSWIAYAPESVVDAQATSWGLTLSKPMIDKTTWFFAAPGGPATGSTQAAITNSHRWNLDNDPVPVILPPPAFLHVGTNNNLYANGDHVWSDPAFFGYAPSLATYDDLMVVHMSYWTRLREELDQHESAAAATLPSPPPNDW